jgi:hypothetical protein
MSRLASRIRAFHHAGLTGILSWPEHHHAADTDSEHLQAGVISYGVTNKGGTIANNTTTKAVNQQAATAGTLTVTWTITAANPALIQVNANSSLTPSTGYPRVTFVLENLSQQAVSIS